MKARLTALAAALGAALIVICAPSASATTPASSFDVYTGSAPLSSYAPGTVLNSRTVQYHLTGVSLPITVVQLLYRSTGAQGQATANVTSVLEPLTKSASPKVVSYQSFYDSLNPSDQPSEAIYGDQTLGGQVSTSEMGLIADFIGAGDTVIIPDTEGQTADFAAGPEYGTDTLDSIRAAENDVATTGIPSTAPVALIGYSGGAIGTEWAAQLAPTYAPDVNKHLIGAAEGGILVDPAHNLQYVSGSTVWAGVIPMAIIGIARAYGVDLEQYMNSYGQSVYAKLESASITQALGAYPGLTWAKLAKPQYANPDSIPIYVDTVNKLDIATIGMPTVPMFMGQGTGGYLEGTPTGGAGIGAGDGVMIAGDVRTLARDYCASGDSVDYQQYDLSHFTSVSEWAPEAETWITEKFAGTATPNNCSSIPTGNSLAPEQLVGASTTGSTPTGTGTGTSTVSHASFSAHQVGQTVEVSAALPAAASRFSFHWELGATFGRARSHAFIARELAIYPAASRRASAITLTGVSGPAGLVSFRLAKGSLSRFSFHLNVKYLWRSARLHAEMAKHHTRTVTGVLTAISATGRRYTKTISYHL